MHFGYLHAIVLLTPLQLLCHFNTYFFLSYYVLAALRMPVQP